MLKLKSSVTTTVKGWMSFWKNTTSCGLPLSRTVKSVSLEIGDEAAVVVEDRRQDGHDAGAAAEGRLLLLRPDRRSRRQNAENRRGHKTHSSSLAPRGMRVNP